MAEKIANPPKLSGPGLKVIHAGLFRTATASMAVAYRTLGYSTHHGLDNVWGNPWVLLERAAEATWPSINKPGAAPFTRQDWDEIWGAEYDVCTDLGSPFVEELIKAYPEAKVVVVQRDFEKWWPSFKSELLDTLFEVNWFFTFFVIPKILRVQAPVTMEKIHYGFFGVRRPEDITEAVARKKYEAYYERVREMVPAERRLEYKMGDGWEPLCKFLGKEVPDVPFPRVNDREAHAAGNEERLRMMRRRFWSTVKPYLFTGAAVGMAAVVWQTYV